MGVAVSGWRLAAAVSRLGQLGVVSGTALALVLARWLQEGDPGGHRRRALEAFPDQAVAARILERYFLARGRGADQGYRAVPVPRRQASRPFLELTVAASFVEVFLAKEGHDGEVGINLLEKIQLPTLPALYGAMLAGVDWVLMGAGIPTNIPSALDALAEQAPAALPLAVAGAGAGDSFTVGFDPGRIFAQPPEPIARPRFIAIVGSHVLAAHLARSDLARPSGFVVEAPIAGGHNAPPRGRLQLTATGEPIYGERDDVDLERMRALGIPFWLAGGYAHPQKLREALEEGAAGIQVGTAFALCEESGLDPHFKQLAREQAAAGRLEIRTDPCRLADRLPVQGRAAAGDRRRSGRVRGARAPLRSQLPDNALPASRRAVLATAVPRSRSRTTSRRGGDASDTVGRVCLCNSLMASAGVPQRRRGAGNEPPIVTLGDDARAVVAALSPDGRPYSAADVIRYLLGTSAAPAA